LVTKTRTVEITVKPASATFSGGPISPEEIADRIVPSDPRISPDGHCVVFVAAPVGKKTEKRTRALWISEDGGPARQFSSGQNNDHAPRWSPDGQRILFLSDRVKSEDDEQGLFLLPVHGGESQQLGDLKGDLSQPGWSPDGRYVAVLRQDPELEETKTRKKERDDAIVVEEDPRFTRLWVIDAETGRARNLTTGDREVRDYGWAPDSGSLVTITTESAVFDAVLGPSELWAVPVHGALPRRIASFASTGAMPIAVESPDGASVVFKADGRREQPSDSVWTVPLAGGKPRNLMPDLNGVVEEIGDLPGSPGKIVARVVERTRARLYAVDVSSGEMEPITPPSFLESGSVIHGVSFNAAGDRLAAMWTDSTTPEEVFVGSVRGSVTPVTTFGQAFKGRLHPVEHVTWLSDDGVEVEGLLTFPAGYQEGTRYPLVVEIHGGPSWQWEDRLMLDWHDWAQMLAGRGYAVLMPNPRGSTGYGHGFQKLLQDDVGGGESRDLISGALAMVERGIADPDRLGIAGWSWGGYLTAWTITQTDIFRAAVMGAGLANMVSDHGQDDIPSANLLYYPGHPYDHMDDYWRSSPIRYVSAVKTPTLILHGDEDARVHPAQGMEYFRALKVLGVPVRFVRYPREKHGIDERSHQVDLMHRIIDWLGRYLMPAAPNGKVKGSA
jgi:dipeptidyl aminopeptidase/acylaminoacyl peptidase